MNDFIESKLKAINTVKDDIARSFKETKDNLPMAFLSCSDEELIVDVIVFPKVYETIPNLKKGDIIKIEGKVERKKDFDIIAFNIVNIKECL